MTDAQYLGLQKKAAKNAETYLKRLLQAVEQAQKLITRIRSSSHVVAPDKYVETMNQHNAILRALAAYERVLADIHPAR